MQKLTNVKLAIDAPRSVFFFLGGGVLAVKVYIIFV